VDAARGPPAGPGVGQTDSNTLRDQRCQSVGWGSGWTCFDLSTHMDVRPYERPSLQLSHTNRGMGLG
jgi:hypothetical protein